MAKTIAATQKGLTPEEAEKKGAEAAQYFMMAVQAVVCIACIAVALGAFANTVANIASKLPQIATRIAAETIDKIGQAAAQASAVVQVAQGATAVAAGVNALQTAELQYDADMANAEVTKLKALIAMLETMLQGDTEFIQMLMELQAKLDAGVAEIVAAETVSNEATDLNNPVTG